MYRQWKANNDNIFSVLPFYCNFVFALTKFLQYWHFTSNPSIVNTIVAFHWIYFQPKKKTLFNNYIGNIYNECNIDGMLGQ